MNRGLEGMDRHGKMPRINRLAKAQHVTKIWETFVEQSPAFKKLILNRILDNADPEYLSNKLTEMDLDQNVLVDRLSHPANQAYTREVFTHPAWVEAAQKVQSAYVRTTPSYFLKNALDNKQPRMFRLRGTPGGALVNGFFEALNDHASKNGIPEEPPETPELPAPRGTPAPLPVGGRRGATPRPTPAPTSRRAGRDAPGAPAPVVPAGVEEFIASHYVEPTIDVFDAVKNGIKHDHALAKYTTSRSQGVDHDVATLMHDAEGFISHMTAHAVDVRKQADLDHFVNAALSEADFHHHIDVKKADPRHVSDLREAMYGKVLPHTSGKADPAILDEYLLPENHKMFDKKEREIAAHEVNIHNYATMRTGLSRVNMGSITKLQRQFAAFHVLTNLLQRGDPDKAGDRLKEFVRKIGHDQTDFHRQVAGLKGKRRLDHDALLRGLENLIPPAEEGEEE